MNTGEFHEYVRQALSPVGAWLSHAEIKEFLERCSINDLVVLTVHGYKELNGFRRSLGFMLFGIEPGTKTPREAKEHFEKELALPNEDLSDVIYNVFL